MWKCDRNLWRGNNGKIYEDGDPHAAFLMATPGMVLESKPVIEGESKALKPAEDKAIAPDEDKAVKPAENKSGSHGKGRGK